MKQSLLKIMSLLGVFLLATLETVVSQPIVNTPGSSVVNGQTLTIAGSGFGTKSPAAPVFYESFNNGTNGTYLTTSGNWPSHRGPDAKYSNTTPYGGSGLCAFNYADKNEGWFYTNYRRFSPQSELYYSYMSRQVGDNSDQIYKNGGSADCRRS